MTKVIQNKTAKKILALLLAVALIIGLCPSITPLGSAHANNDTQVTALENGTETGLGESGNNDPDNPDPNENPEGGEGEDPIAPIMLLDDDPTDPVDNGEDPEPSVENETPAEVDTPVEGETPEEVEEAIEKDLEGNEPTEEPKLVVEPEDIQQVSLQNVEDPQSVSNESNKFNGVIRVKNSLNDSNPQKVESDDTNPYTIFSRGTWDRPVILEIEGTVMRDIKISGGSAVHIIGKGENATLKGTGNGSVVQVTGSRLVVGNASGGIKGTSVTITGGIGSPSNGGNPGALNAGENLGFGTYAKLGGGILVQRNSDSKNCSTLILRDGAIIDSNKAEAGGGIFVDARCRFAMLGGTVSNNTADGHEGGGIYLKGGYNGSEFDDTEARIQGGKITNNKTINTKDWGGGGIFVETKRTLQFGDEEASNNKDLTLLIKGNTAAGLGGGIAGCPHAKMGVGTIGAGVVFIKNVAEKSNPLKGVGSLHGGISSSGGNLPGADKWAYLAEGDFPATAANDYYCVSGSDLQPGLGANYADQQVWDITYITHTPNDWPEKDQKFEVYKNDKIVYGNGAFYADESVTVGATWTGPTTIINPNNVIEISDNYSSTNGGGIGCNGKININLDPTTPPSTDAEQVTKQKFSPAKFTIKKELLALDGQAKPTIEDGKYTFRLTAEKDGDPLGITIAKATNDKNGDVTFELTHEALQQIDKDVYTKYQSNQLVEYKLYISEDTDSFNTEVAKEESSCGEANNVHEVTLKLSFRLDKNVVITTGSEEGANTNTLFEYHQVEFKGISAPKHETPDNLFTITNKLTGNAGWTPSIIKKYLNMPEEGGSASFTLTEIDKPKNGSALPTPNADDYTDTTTVEYKAGSGQVTGKFKEIAFFKENDDHWYLLVEDDAPDQPVYVIQVTTEADNALSIPGKQQLTTKTKTYFADSADSLFDDQNEYTENDGTPLFVNNGLTGWTMSSYAIHATSGRMLSQTCLVDPKIYKELSGRTLEEGEFVFQLVQTSTESLDALDTINNGGYDYTTSPVISTATNDRYGMVDFDAANNVNPDENGEPCCLEFNAPGIYKYRVIEEPNAKRNPSVVYSTDVITFTAVVEQVDGALKCTQMYYGKLVDGVNQVYKESENDPTWHPTMVNEATPMDLKVRKTTVLDRNTGLDGATYGLYMVNDAEQEDVLLAESTSPEGGDGWITYSDVPLSVGNTYYFREIAAPNGHTVDPQRSKYFSLVADDSSATGYSLQYRDTKAGTGTLVRTGANSDSSSSTTPGTVENNRQVYTYSDDGGVYDETTDVSFSKRDAENQNWVTGAKLAIIENDSNKTIDEWTTGQTVHQVKAQLNVGTSYILRELEAPEGYAKADDAVFHMDDYGALILDSGATKDNLRNAEVAGNALTLYDTAITGQGSQAGDSTGAAGKGSLPKTGDTLFPIALSLVGLLAASGTLFVVYRRRNREQS